MRIVLVLPCCIGDVVLGTAVLTALRRAYPQAHIAWAVGEWSAQAVANHPHVDELIDTGRAALPLYNLTDFWRFVGKLRAGCYDLMVSLVRSPLMSLAALASGIPQRAGLDSGGRGFGYTHRARVDPHQVRHESEIYLETCRVLGLNTQNATPNVPLDAQARQQVRALLDERGLRRPYIVLNPGGGVNPGMTLSAKRYPIPWLAEIGLTLAQENNAALVLLGGPDDGALLEVLRSAIGCDWPMLSLAGRLSFPQIGALAYDSLLYLGNDSGLTHYASAIGAPTVMLLGPTDPRRYGPAGPNSLALWKPWQADARGVSAGVQNWDWECDGLRPEAALAELRAWLG
ncbi:MAG: glycosyltransferase family 9 protein [Anaerolineae bacterium]|nr:glycosyltransferase family 9 protein [Anaerolineae bacterium]MDW8172821.1 glycosyltransferase family 9 protein [Anaerolineae bacterium]